MHAQLNIALTAAREGARLLGHQIDRLDRVRILEGQGDQTVTSAHVEIERALLFHLQKLNPRHGFHSTISGQSGSAEADVQWLIDPLYGCANFLRNTPGFGVAVLCRVKGRMAHAALVDPFLNEEYTVTAGGSANLGSKRLRVSTATRLNESLVALDFPASTAQSESAQALLAKLLSEGAGIRSSGSAVKVLLDVAAGRLEAARVRAPKSHGMSAALLVLQEAGGLVGDEAGNPEPTGDWLIFGNPKCFRQLLKLQSN